MRTEPGVRTRPRLFSGALGPRERRVYGAATLWFLVVSLAMSWPVYPLVSRVRPMVLGMPLSLFWLAALLVASFGVAVGLFLWELQRGALDRPDEDEAG